MGTESSVRWASLCTLLVFSVGLPGCKCSASASFETEDVDRPGPDSGAELPMPPDVIPAEASAIPANIPTFLIEHCLARFTRDAKLVDPLGKGSLELKSGDVRVLSEWLDTPKALDITPQGVREYQIESKGRGLPFESNCRKGETGRELAVFVDSTVYRSEAFDEELCQLKAGTTTGDAPNAFSNHGGRLFRFALGGFSESCKGADDGFVRIENVSETDPRKLSPVHTVLAPREK